MKDKLSYEVERELSTRSDGEIVVTPVSCTSGCGEVKRNIIMLCMIMRMRILLRY